MFKTTSIAAAASLALATLPALAIATGAHAAPAAVKVADLNLNTAAGQKAFAQRVDKVAVQMCREVRAGRFTDDNCVNAVRAEAQAKAAAITPSQMAAR